MAKKNILFMGPLPPPVHGFSIINEKMLKLLEAESPVEIFDVRPPTMRFGSKVARSLRLLLIPFVAARFLIACFSNKNASFYIGISGGSGQVIDSLFLLTARAFKIPTYIHHHSFAYINQIRWYNKIAFSISRNQRHIVLCDSMRDALSELYRINKSKISVISNVAFMPATPPPVSCKPPVVTLGYISNISAQKGIFSFIELIEKLNESGKEVSARIAGPLDNRIAGEFRQRIQKSSNITYTGPVYDKEKAEFYKSLDILVFPTRYINEAEPLILWEGMANGLAIISISRGCISCTIPQEAGVVARSPDDFPQVALAELETVISNPATLQARQEAAYNHYCRCRNNSLSELERIIEEIAG